jgi:hypothetical protein
MYRHIVKGIENDEQFAAETNLSMAYKLYIYVRPYLIPKSKRYNKLTVTKFQNKV